MFKPVLNIHQEKWHWAKTEFEGQSHQGLRVKMCSSSDVHSNVCWIKHLFCNLLWIERFILNLIFKCTVEILFDQHIILFALNRWFHVSAQKDNKIIMDQLEFYWRLLTSQVLIYWLLIFAMQLRAIKFRIGLNINIYFKY